MYKPGHYYQVLIAPGLVKDARLLAADDALGRKIQDADLTANKRASKRH